MTDKSNASETNDKDAVPAAVTPEKGAAGKTGAEASADSEGKKAKPATSGKKKVKEKSSSGGGFTLLLLLLVAAGSGAGGYYFWQQSLGQKQQLATVDAEVDRQQQQIVQLQKNLQKAQRASAQQQQQGSGDRELLQAITQRLDSHNKRLLSLSSTSREDWLLAEAEYLLRLANQRLLMERGTRGAQSLLEAADNILRELDDVDLFPVRKALASDLAALKLAAQVDREGLYLRLAALSEQVMQLELLVPEQVLPSVNDDKPEPQAPLLPATESTGELLESLFARLRQSLSAALQQVGDYVRVRQRSEPVEPLLSPDESLYLSQNLRMMLERAQLAMLREEPEVYRHSLEQARRWLRTYYRLNAKTPQLQQALAELQQVPVAQELPDISGSLAQLKAYIERLHKLGGSQAKTAQANTARANTGQAQIDQEK